MGVKLTSLKANIERETNGDWQDIPDVPGLRLKVRSFQYSPYRMARDLLMQRLLRKYGKRPIPPETLTQEYGKLYAEHILLDVDGLVDDNDQPIKWTRDLGIEYLCDVEYRPLFEAVEWAAGAVGEVETEFVADAVKNSKPPSATT